MIPATLHDVFHNPERDEAWLVLAEESGQHGLPIFVGSNLQILISELWRKKPRPLKNPRPLTFTFFASVLEAIGAELSEVQVVGLVDNTFHAVACVRSGGTDHRIDARPSDAVALAVCMKRPIFVAEEVMAAAGRPLGAGGHPPDLPEGFVSTRPLWTDDVESNEG